MRNFGPLLSFSEKPSNIALVKYMGKVQKEKDFEGFQNSHYANSTAIWTFKNQALNPSLSLTLDYLRTRVEIYESTTIEDLEQDKILPLHFNSFAGVDLTEQGRERFLKHFQNLKEYWKLSGSYTILTGNNFPSDCGLASSASSFAALTDATAKCVEKLKGQKISIAERSRLSRAGSGSSIRSFYGPFCVWRGENAISVDHVDWDLIHQVIVISSSKKEVSSSEAHLRVLSSPKMKNRPDRVELRLSAILQALKTKNWAQLYQNCWDEFYDMHELFSTSSPPFSYWNQDVDLVLTWIKNYWDQHGDGPVVTMDAGPNIHFLTRKDQADFRRKVTEEFKTFKFYSSHKI